MSENDHVSHSSSGSAAHRCAGAGRSPPGSCLQTLAQSTSQHHAYAKLTLRYTSAKQWI